MPPPPNPRFVWMFSTNSGVMFGLLLNLNPIYPNSTVYWDIVREVFQLCSSFLLSSSYNDTISLLIFSCEPFLIAYLEKL